MFGNKKRDERIESLEQILGYEYLKYVKTHVNIKEGEITELFRKLKALEDYLQIEYKEETTKGYVKKELELLMDTGEEQYFMEKNKDGSVNWYRGRKSNNKKK